MKTRAPVVKKNFALCFNYTSCRYSVHATDCPACISNSQKVRLGGDGYPEFDTIAEAKAWAHADESEKAGEPVKALLSVCKCARKV